MALATTLFIGLLSVPVPALAQDGIQVDVTPDATCGQVAFDVSVVGGTPPYSLLWEFGDTETLSESDILAFPRSTSHTYPAQGEFAWALTVSDGGDPSGQGSASGSVAIDGPQVTLETDVLPSIYPLTDGEVEVHFSALVSGGAQPYVYQWDFGGDGIDDPVEDSSVNTSSFTYQEAGTFLPSVTVLDQCGMADTDTMRVIIVDDQESTGCHPRAQQIADALDTLFPSQAAQYYTCEDITAFFQGGLTGSQLGFGRMWQAYQIALRIEDLTWEDILDWHLEGNGWGLLLQLDRFADALDEVGVSELVERVMSGETTVGEIRTAVRAVTRYGASFEDALERLGEGASPGQLTQFYRLAQEMDVDPEVLDQYAEIDIPLAEIRHAVRLAEGYGADWATLVEAHGAGNSWGEIHQAYRLAGDESGAEAILETGSREWREQEREQSRDTRQAELVQRIADRLAEQYGIGVDEVLSVFNDACGGDWSCVRSFFRDGPGGGHGSSHGGGGQRGQ
jgi:PKD repeat protein